jgi:hypothetical protein
MKLYLRNTCSIGALLTWIVTSVTYVAAEEEVILSGTDSLRDGETIEAQDANCRLIMNGDGNVIVRRRISGLDDTVDGWPTSWSTHSIHSEADYTLELTSDGNLAVYEEADAINETRAIVWTTNHPGDISASHKLVMDGACRLKIKSDDVDVWENIKITPFQAGQVLQRGEQFRMSGNFESADDPDIAHGFVIHYVMLLQHDCNLVQFVGTDNADTGAVVWKSGTQMPEGTDCYLYLDNGHADLYSGMFDNSLGFNATRPGKFFSTPADWFSQEATDVDKENYEIVLQSDGSIFTYRV